MLATHIGEGARYSEIPQVVMLTLLQAKHSGLPHAEGLVTTAGVYRDIDGQLSKATDRLEFVVADVAAAVERCNRAGIESVRNEADAWMLVLALGAEEDGLTEALKERFPSLEQFAERYGLAASDPEVIETVRARPALLARDVVVARALRACGTNGGYGQLILQGIIAVEVVTSELGVDEAGFLALCDQFAE